MPDQRQNEPKQTGNAGKTGQDEDTHQPRSRTGGQTDSATGSKPGGGGPSQSDTKKRKDAK